ncbi:MAG: MBL fold metallo-hydrolase RNA specificity domain-containing protein [Pirellulales bacterium]
MFHFDGGLFLTSPRLAIDCRRRQPQAFVSHAHSDHMARHDVAICTPATGRLYQLRLGQRKVRELPYRQPLDYCGVQLTTYPAGHCLGSAMLLADDGQQSLLYTGDFKLGESATSERAELPQADLLVLECTYGEPEYRLTPRAQVIADLLELVRRTLTDEATPVIQAYTLGKSQEVTRILTLAGIPVLQHRSIFEVSQVYSACGVDLGDYRVYADGPLPGHAVIVPPRMHRPETLPGLKRVITIAVTGWAMKDAVRGRWGADYAMPLSDHADYDELFDAVARVAPREVYCTHGPETFADRLREAGYNAHTLGKGTQLRLF